MQSYWKMNQQAAGENAEGRECFANLRFLLCWGGRKEAKKALEVKA